MRRRIVLIIGLLEVYALCLAVLGYHMGLHTDEAKYLLSIPYPHPPAIRTLLSLGLSLPFHEFLMRFLIASAAVQSVWFLWDLGVVLPGRRRRVALAAAWLLSTSFIVQSGTVMLAPVTAVFGLLFMWAALTAEPSRHCRGSCVGLLWLFALFSAYQSILYAPLVWHALRRDGQRLSHSILYFCIPVGLLALYSFGHPLPLASALQFSSRDAHILLADRLRVWLVIVGCAGGIVTSIVGMWGILAGRRWDLLLSSAFVLLWIFLVTQEYYAILLLPLLCGGVYVLLRHRRLPPAGFLVLQTVVMIAMLIIAFPTAGRNVARETMAVLVSRGIEGTIVIDGPYGHDWQYESSSPIRTFTQELRGSIEDSAAVFLCTKNDCTEDVDTTKWTVLPGMPVEAWQRRN